MALLILTFDFVYKFLDRPHRDRLAYRMCENIKRTRVADEYFDNLKNRLKGVPPTNIINYDKTNLTDDRYKKIGHEKNAETSNIRVTNKFKVNTSIMYASVALTVQFYLCKQCTNRRKVFFRVNE